MPFAISLALTIFALFIYSYTFIGDRPTALFSFINRLELDALDLRFRLRPESYKNPDPRIVIVDIDQRSQEVLGRWPFSRTYFAKTLDALREDGAKVAAFDITFSKPDETSAPIRELRNTVMEREKHGGKTDPRPLRQHPRRFSVPTVAGLQPPDRPARSGASDAEFRRPVFADAHGHTGKYRNAEQHTARRPRLDWIF